MPVTADSRLAAATRNPQLLRAALALHENRLHDAEPLLKAHLHADPFDVAAMRLLAELAARIGRTRDSETLLRRALELAPDFNAARGNLAMLLYRGNRAADALAELAHLRTLGGDDNPNLRAAARNQLGDFEEAITIYEDTLRRNPEQPRVWMSFGHVLKTVGRLADGIAAYRHAVTQLPHFGEAWWSLANLKTVALNAADVAIMTAQLKRADLEAEDRFHLDFALGKAAEDAGEAARAFAHYAAANTGRRALLPYDPVGITAQVDAAMAIFTPDFFAARAGLGAESTAPIFILGMPRAGSTLIEQILSSHTQVEGLAELPDVPSLWSSLGAHPLQALANLTPDAVRALGEDYLRRAAQHRKSDRPFFIDKLPNNWLYTGFIKTILPYAKIIDARRHPLSCGFSNFKQHYARGQAFSYDLADIGHYYTDYVRMMARVDAVLPGAVHRVIYERMVDDTEGEIRALLGALKLPFEAACLTFHETERAVRTPSSEQVRAPIFRSGIENWQAFAPWLGPLQDALGPTLTAYPDPPQL
jgi:tetratricopeptide (TPR) repeat protein